VNAGDVARSGNLGPAELARSEASLRERLARLESIIEGSQLGTWEWNVQTDHFLVNERWAEMLGYRLAELPAHADTWRRLVAPEDRQEARRVLELHFAGKLPLYECEFRMRHRDGHWVWVQARARIASRTVDGKPLTMAGTQTDITPRKQAEEEARLALQQREVAQRRSAEIIATVDGIVWEADARTFRFTFVSAQAERMLGYPIASWLDDPSFWADHLHPDDRELAVAYCMACTQEMRDHHFDYRLRAADGRYLWMQDVVTVVAEAGRPVQLRGFMMDITARKSAEEALRTSQAFLSTIFQGCAVSVFVVEVSESGGYTYSAANSTHERLLGVKNEDLVGRSPADLVPLLGQEIVDFAISLYDRCVRERAPIESEFQVPDGQAAGWWFTRLTPLFDADGGRVVRLIGNGIPITSRKNAEEALRESEERLRLAVRASNVGLWDWDLSTHRVRYSREWKAQLGYEEDEIGEGFEEWQDRVHPDDLPGTLERVRRYLAAPVGGIEAELRLRHKDGTWRWIYTRSEVVCDEGGQPLRVLGCHVDVTERRMLEEQLRQSQRMDAIGQLAGGVAHDFNNLLTVIQGNGALLREEDEPLSAQQREALDELLQAAERAAALTRQLLTFSRRQRIEARALDLNAVVRDLCNMLQRLLGEDVRLQLELAPAALAIRADPSLLEQVLVNLAVNARDAMPSGGRLLVETRQVLIGPDDASAGPDAKPGPHALLRVADGGAGILPEHLPHIFEPFFTTKEVGKGTGLGLATVFGIVREHGGWVRVASELGRGTRFDVFIPLLAAQAAASDTDPLASGASAPSALHGGSETILVVEDEESVRRLVQRVLSGAGYHVFTAASGADALVLLGQGGLQVDLVLTDLIMPGGISGQELGRRLREGRPEQRILYMSGYPRENSARGGPDRLRLHPGASTLAKPFTPASLLDGVRECLAGR
jgi:two-component system, cell cycle sensor histidine kinase and response regulator CckA